MSDLKNEKLIKDFWKAIAMQDKELLRDYFKPNAVICWHATNEKFNVEEFLIANCEYPGKWQADIEKIEQYGSNRMVTITHVKSLETDFACYATSFFELEGDKIVSLDEYWADVAEPPQWRKEKNIGIKIKK